MMNKWLAIAASIALLALPSAILADEQERLAGWLAGKIEVLGSSATSDRQPTTEGILMLIGPGSVPNDSIWTSLELTGCALTIRLGLAATGSDLPKLYVELDLQDPAIQFSATSSDQNARGGWEFVQMTAGTSEPTLYIITTPPESSLDQIMADVRLQAFEAQPAPRFVFMVNFSADSVSPVPELLDRIETYRSEYCRLSS